MCELDTNKADLTKFAIEKIEKATGFIFDPYGTKRESRQQLVSRIKSLNLPPLEEAAMISKASKIIKEYINQNDIIQIALDNLNSRQLQEPPKFDDIDDEFLSRFFDSAKHISNDDIKLIWGRILANEISSPNSIPRYLIHILSIIDSTQAETFMIICKHCLLDDKLYPFIDYFRESEYWLSHGLSTETLLDLQAIGLITVDIPNVYCIVNDHMISSKSNSFYNAVYRYSDYIINIKVEQKYLLDENTIKIGAGNIFFTDAGFALASVVNAEYSEEALEHIIEYIRRQGFLVSYGTVIKETNDVY